MKLGKGENGEQDVRWSGSKGCNKRKPRTRFMVQVSWAIVEASLCECLGVCDAAKPLFNYR